MEAISDALRFEVREFGVDVMLIEPGLIKTEFGETAAKGTGDGGDYAAFNEAVAKATAGAYEGPTMKLGGGPETWRQDREGDRRAPPQGPLPRHRVGADPAHAARAVARPRLGPVRGDPVPAPGEELMDRLTSIDAGFLAQEREGSHMHIGSVMLFEGPPPPREEFIEHISSRLHLVPRYRQKLAFPRLELGRPLWVDDPRFNIDYHVRVTALPEPGEPRAAAPAGRPDLLPAPGPLQAAVGDLARARALEPDRFALINKTHHCLVDGVSGVDITTVLFDLDRNPDAVDGAPDPWTPAPEPSDAAIAAQGVADLVGTPFRLARDAVTAVSDPGRTLGQARDAVEAVGEVASGLVAGAPKTPLNQHCGSHRRVVWIHADLAELKAIKNALGGTVNDVFLTSSRVRCSAGCARAACAPRAWSCAAPCPCRCGPGRARPARQQDHDHGRSLPVYAQDPVALPEIVTDSMST